MKKNKALLLAVVLVLIAVIAIVCMSVFGSNKDKDKEKESNEADKSAAYSFNYDLNSRETSGFFINASGSFMYFTPVEGGIYEYDLVGNKQIDITEKMNSSDQSVVVSTVMLYDGKIFSCRGSVDGKSPTKLSLYDPTTDKEELISETDAKYQASDALISADGTVFYTVDTIGDGSPQDHLDENGYESSRSLKSFRLDDKQEVTLVNGLYSYKISGDRIYFDKMKPSGSLHLYYISFEEAKNGSAPHDTGIDVGDDINGCMWTVHDGLIYYASDDTNELRSYDTASGETKTVFSSDKGIRKFDFLNDRIVYFTRYRDKEVNAYRNVICLYDPASGEDKVICKGASDSDKDFDPVSAEMPFGFAVIPDTEQLVICSLQYGLGCTRYYKYSADGEGELISEISWNYSPSEEN